MSRYNDKLLNNAASIIIQSYTINKKHEEEPYFNSVLNNAIKMLYELPQIRVKLSKNVSREVERKTGIKYRLVSKYQNFVDLEGNNFFLLGVNAFDYKNTLKGFIHNLDLLSGKGLLTIIEVAKLINKQEFCYITRDEELKLIANSASNNRPDANLAYELAGIELDY